MAVKWLDSIESPSGRIARWALELQQYDFDIAYRKSQLMVVAEAQSAGNVGSWRTIARLAAQYYWPGMHRDARAHVRK